MAGEWWLSGEEKEEREAEWRKHAARVKDKSGIQFAEKQSPIAHKGGRQPSAATPRSKPRGLLGRLMPKRREMP